MSASLSGFVSVMLCANKSGQALAAPPCEFWRPASEMWHFVEVGDREPLIHDPVLYEK